MTGLPMKTMIRRLLAATLLPAALLLAPAVFAASPSETVDAFYKALAQGDAKGAAKYLGKEVVVFEQGYINDSREDYVKAQIGEAAKFAKATRREVIRREAWQEGNIAWVLSSTLTTGTFNGQKLALDGAETMVLRKLGDGWMITHIHWSAHPAAEKP